MQQEEEEAAAKAKVETAWPLCEERESRRHSQSHQSATAKPRDETKRDETRRDQHETRKSLCILWSLQGGGRQRGLGQIAAQNLAATNERVLPLTSEEVAGVAGVPVPGVGEPHSAVQAASI